MNAFDIVGWSFDADLHCTACARTRFGKALFDEENPPEDREGNEVHPIFASDFDGDSENCGDCADPIFDAEDEDEDDEEFAADCHDCEPGCPGDSAHLDGFCARAKAEDDPCTVCGGKLEGSLAVCCGQCDNCR